jgi:hypothetical protein
MPYFVLFQFRVVKAFVYAQVDNYPELAHYRDTVFLFKYMMTPTQVRSAVCSLTIIFLCSRALVYVFLFYRRRCRACSRGCPLRR